MIKAVEDAMIARLETAIGGKSARPIVRTVDTLPSQLDDAELDRRIRQAPGCYVAFLGGPARASQSLIVDIRMAVYVLTQSGIEADRRRGGTAQAGAYVILLLAAGTLHGFKVPNIGTLMLDEISNMFSEALDQKGVSLYAAVFKIPLTVPNADDVKAMAAFVTLHADWLLAPDGPQDPPLPIPLPAPGSGAVGEADAADTLTLPQGDH